MVKDTTLPKGYKQTDIGIVPPPDWVLRKLGDVARFQNGKAHEKDMSEDGKYVVINSKFISTEGEVKKFSDSCLCPVYQEDVVMVMSDVPDGRAIAKCFYVDKNDKYTLNQRICSLKAKDVNSRFLFYQLNRNPYYLSFDDGVKQTNLRKDDVLSCLLKLPPTKAEQTAIATALSDADRLITVLEKLIAKKRNIKQGAMQELLTGKKRLPGFNGKWEVKKLGEILTYEQPTKYLVKSTEYDDNNDIAVLTANKSFILGYTNETDGVFENLPVIIFDDFTTASKYVNFPFKVKSSALKVLKLKDRNYDLRFAFGKMQLIQFPLGDHKRYWISEYQNLEIEVPSLEEQTSIAQILSDMDTEIDQLQQKFDKYRMIKQGMMQELLTGKKRLI